MIFSNRCICIMSSSFIFFSSDISRCKNATRHFIDDIIEEIDPLIISKWISVKAKEELHFSELERLRERKKRATKFSLQLLRTSQSIFYEALHAMTACGYENLVENITTLANEGTCIYQKK